MEDLLLGPWVSLVLSICVVSFSVILSRPTSLTLSKHLLPKSQKVRFWLSSSSWEKALLRIEHYVWLVSIWLLFPHLAKECLFSPSDSWHENLDTFPEIKLTGIYDSTLPCPWTLPLTGPHQWSLICPEAVALRKSLVQGLALIRTWFSVPSGAFGVTLPPSCTQEEALFFLAYFSAFLLTLKFYNVLNTQMILSAYYNSMSPE